METAITSLIVVALIVLTLVGLSQAALTAQANIAASSGQMQERLGERARTNINALSAQALPADAAGASVQVTLKNTGSVKLASFDQWDVILQSNDGTKTQARWYPFGNSANQWQETIFQSAAALTPEVIEPGILDPGEEMIVTINVSPAVALGTTNLAIITTPNGISASTVFTH